jgi:hypothetical protein
MSRSVQRSAALAALGRFSGNSAATLSNAVTSGAATVTVNAGSVEFSGNRIARLTS